MVTSNQLYAELVYDVMKHGWESAPRGLPVKEILNYQLVLDDPRDRLITWPQRKLPKRYLGAEWIWYLSGDQYASAIAEYAPFWSTLADNKGKINSNYGHRLFGYTVHPKTTAINHHQFKTVVEILKRDKYSRQAICHINLPADIELSLKGSKDVPCTLNLLFHIRNDELHMTVNMRSNDAVLGYTIDLFQFTLMQELMLNLLKPHYPKLRLGKYYHNAASMHFYQRDWEMCEHILHDYNHNNVPPAIVMKPMEFLQDDPWVEIAYLINLGTAIRGQKEPNWEEHSEWNFISEYWQNFMRVCFDTRHRLEELV